MILLVGTLNRNVEINSDVFQVDIDPPLQAYGDPTYPPFTCMVDFVLFTVEPVPTLDSHTPHHIQLVHTQISPIPCVSHTKQCPHMGAK